MGVLGDWEEVFVLSRTGLGNKCALVSNQSNSSGLGLWVLPSKAVEVRQSFPPLPGRQNGLRAPGNTSSLLMAGTDATSLMPRNWRQRRAAGSPQTAIPTLHNCPCCGAKTRDSKDTKSLIKSPVKSCLAQAVLRAVGKVSA